MYAPDFFECPQAITHLARNLSPAAVTTLVLMLARENGYPANTAPFGAPDLRDLTGWKYAHCIAAMRELEAARLVKITGTRDSTDGYNIVWEV